MTKGDMIDYVTFLTETANNLFKEASAMEDIKDPTEEDVINLARIEAKLEIIKDIIHEFTQLVMGKKKR